MDVTFDHKDGSLSITKDGIRQVRRCQVTGVTGDKAGRHFRASQAAGLPQYGDAHPIIPGLHVTNIEVEEASDDSTTQFDVEIVYERPDFDEGQPDEADPQPTVRVSTTLVQATTQKNRAGEQLNVSITKEDGSTDTQTGEVEILIPLTIITLSRRERYAALYKQLAFAQYVNDRDIGIFRERTLLCTGIESDSSDGGVTYDVTYNFQFNRATWDADIVYVDVETDKPHQDIDIAAGNGYARAEIYGARDFNQLSLDFGFSQIPPFGIDIYD